MSKLIDYAGLTEFYIKFQKQIKDAHVVNLVYTETNSSNYSQNNYKAFKNFINTYYEFFSNAGGANFIAAVKTPMYSKSIQLHFVRYNNNGEFYAISNFNIDINTDSCKAEQELFLYKLSISYNCCYFTKTKIGGSGDVTLAGNNTFTGTNTFCRGTVDDKVVIQDCTPIEFNSAGDKVIVEQMSAHSELILSDGNNGYVTISGIKTPTSDDEAVNKKYVDDQITAVGGGSSSSETAVVLDFLDGGTSYTVPDADYTKLQAGNCLVYAKLYSSSDFIQLQRDNNGSDSTANGIEYIGYSSANFKDPIRVTVKSTKVASYASIAGYNDIELNRVQRHNANSSISLSATSLSKMVFIGDNVITELPYSNSYLSWDMFVVGTVTLPTITDTYNFVGMEAPSDLKLTAGFYKVLYYNYPSVRDKIYTIYKLA